jgi:hypothetical protein
MTFAIFNLQLAREDSTSRLSARCWASYSIHIRRVTSSDQLGVVVASSVTAFNVNINDVTGTPDERQTKSIHHHYSEYTFKGYLHLTRVNPFVNPSLTL